jgi:hypothetical protein
VENSIELTDICTIALPFQFQTFSRSETLNSEIGAAAFIKRARCKSAACKYQHSPQLPFPCAFDWTFRRKAIGSISMTNKAATCFIQREWIKVLTCSCRVVEEIAPHWVAPHWNLSKSKPSLLYVQNTVQLLMWQYLVSLQRVDFFIILLLCGCFYLLCGSYSLCVKVYHINLLKAFKFNGQWFYQISKLFFTFLHNNCIRGTWC